LSKILGMNMSSSNECNVFEVDRKFGLKTSKPISSQMTLVLEPNREATQLTWTVESNQTGFFKLPESLLIKGINDTL